MEDLRLCDSEYRFMLLVWELSPVRSGDLVKTCRERLGWKKSTTYTVIKKLAERGFLKSEDALVTALVGKEECQAAESDYFIERTFEGSLPKFVAAFLGNKKISEKEAGEIKAMIDSHKESC
ncbi:MAG: BlaI/MecI/CopY family transcriptional regulator [Lachnospiraceae bacterium]